MLDPGDDSVVVGCQDVWLNNTAIETDFIDMINLQLVVNPESSPAYRNAGFQPIAYRLLLSRDAVVVCLLGYFVDLKKKASPNPSKGHTHPYLDNMLCISAAGQLLTKPMLSSHPCGSLPADFSMIPVFRSEEHETDIAN